MANQINEMGSEVIEGFQCKPKDFDPNRAMMHYKTLLLICSGTRCSNTGETDKASYLRKLIKEMGLNKGKNRIKVTRTGCYGACRFKQVCQITENTQVNGNPKNSALWLQQTHKFTEKKWREILTLLSEDKILTEELDRDDFIPMRAYE
jgi:hypothetical protein